MSTTNSTETASDPQELEDPQPQEETRDPTFLEQQASLVIAQQARAMADLEADRCLLRRDMKARQNTQYGLPQDTLPECEEDDMGVQVGDNTDNSKVVHNHYHNECPDPPQPQPPARRWPWWLIAALVLPWIVFAFILVAWILSNWPDSGGSAQPVIWQLDIGAENPELPEPPTIQPAGETQ